MAARRIAARYISRRLSSSGKILSEEEKAAENVFIKKTEQEKLEKLARKGPKADQPPATAETPASGVKPSTTETSTTGGVSTDKNRNYAVVAGTVAAVSAFGWWFFSKPKKSEEIVD
ncbi:uncharacterized protein A4U43_C10F17040 [Asparagus officinalis]|uniref:Uncharacterized protein n=1 Tax=Asparagus officinalis TaxID=4686 RepID=A0A5P1E3B4_ASPOF|nr:uncharacterized protein At2g27730, mitochondrial [Asparagus officinalis]ONK57142.1 uncharacterized protein A4U43_C10F17040 [Asparagus officinalis]